MSIQDLVVYPRETVGKRHAGRLRRQGLTPSVVYGLKGESTPVCVEPKIVNKIIRSEKGLNTVLNLRLDGTEKTRHVMIKSIDRHPVSDRLLHVDFLRIDMDKEINAVIPFDFVGNSPGVKLGGIMNTVFHEIEVICLPNNLPSVITVDVSGLGMDESIRVEDLPQMDGVVYQLDLDQVIAVIHAPEKEEEEAEGDEEIPEVVAAPQPPEEEGS